MLAAAPGKVPNHASANLPQCRIFFGGTLLVNENGIKDTNENLLTSG